MGTFHTKKEIVSDDIPDVFAIDIKTPFFPVTVSWDSTLFQNEALHGTLFTSVPHGGWWDVASPCNFIKVTLSERSSLQFTDNILPNGNVNINYAYVEGQDTISVFWFAFGPEGIGVSTENVSLKKSIEVFPNPATSQIHISKNQEFNIQKIVILDTHGNTVLEQKSLDNPIDVSTLNPGIFILHITTKNGQRATKKFFKF